MKRIKANLVTRWGPCAINLTAYAIWSISVAYYLINSISPCEMYQICLQRGVFEVIAIPYPKKLLVACQTSWLRTDIGHGEQWLAMTWTQMSPPYTIYCVSVLCSYRYQRELREFIVHLFVRPSEKQMEISSTIFRTVWFYQKGREVVVSPVSVYYRMKLKFCRSHLHIQIPSF